MEIFFLTAGVAGAVTASLVRVALVLSKHIHGKHTLDTDDGVQKFHTTPTPRVGGIAIVAGFFASWIFMQGEARSLWALIGLDALLAFPLVAFAFTAFAVGGVANSINLIDGFHGLASGTLMIILLAFALVGERVGDTVLVSIAVTMLMVVAGFFAVNFPGGKLFLGDAGAYFAGYVVAVLAVMLPARNPEVSPWVSLLILGYPVTETLFSILRRQRKDGHSPGEPDSDHLHHMVHRGWALGFAQNMRSSKAKNAMTSVFIWALPAITLLAAMFSDLGTVESIILLVLSIIVYLIFYRMTDVAGRRLANNSRG